MSDDSVYSESSNEMQSEAPSETPSESQSGYSEAEEQELMSQQSRINGQKRILAGIEEQMSHFREKLDAVQRARRKEEEESWFPSQEKIKKYKELESRIYERLYPIQEQLIEQANLIRRLEGRREFVVRENRMGGEYLVDPENKNVHIRPGDPISPIINEDPLGDTARARGLRSGRPVYTKRLARSMRKPNLRRV